LSKTDSINGSSLIEFPDFESIIMHCKTLMSLKFPEYGNSWKEKDYEFQQHIFQLDNKFWDDRLKQEVKEFLKAKNVADARKELADIINICSMIYEKCTFTSDRYWRYG